MVFDCVSVQIWELLQYFLDSFLTPSPHTRHTEDFILAAQEQLRLGRYRYQL